VANRAGSFYHLARSPADITGADINHLTE
jgi:hypothetical protein